ncbi:MAG: antitoxin VapB family protein [Nitrososphaerota archaeon]|jgi:predicted CopG family antitoxin|nr:antitoxin VapB family protein [Nitrososphaerota archaeon]MDG6923082.1 antitoxin VapB family protein [Nitrososphaerota archaeon]
MAHKNITISEEANAVLATRKRENESFTDVILRVTSDKGKASSLLKLVDSWTPDEDLAKSVDSAMKKMRKSKLRIVNLQKESH